MNRTVLITRCSSGSDLLGERRGSVGNRDCAAFEGLAAAVPSLPRDEGGPVFREPWEARVFAITLALYQRCLHLAGMGRSAVQRDQARAGGWRSLSRRHLLPALAQRAEKGVIDRASLSRAIATPWAILRARPPHGQPIELKAEDSVLNFHCQERSDEAIPIRETPIDEIVEITVAAQGPPWSQSASTKAEANRMRAQTHDVIHLMRKPRALSGVSSNRK